MMARSQTALSLCRGMVALTALTSAAAYGQLYQEDFDDGSVDEFDNGYCEVRWCDADDMTTSVST